VLKVEKTAGVGGFETSGTRARGVGAAVGTFEGVAAAVLAGEDYLVIASDTKQHVRVAHSVFIEQNVGY
jgi:hypothetical protein